MGGAGERLGGAGGVAVWSGAHLSEIASSTFEDQVRSGLAPAAHLKNGLSGSQGENGACRSEGLERLVAGQHVPDRLGQFAGELDLRDLRAALTAQAPLGALVALLVERVRGGVRPRLPSAPSASILGPCLDSGPRRSSRRPVRRLSHCPRCGMRSGRPALQVTRSWTASQSPDPYVSLRRDARVRRMSASRGALSLYRTQPEVQQRRCAKHGVRYSGFANRSRRESFRNRPERKAPVSMRQTLGTTREGRRASPAREQGSATAQGPLGLRIPGSVRMLGFAATRPASRCCRTSRCETWPHESWHRPESTRSNSLP